MRHQRFILSMGLLLLGASLILAAGCGSGAKEQRVIIIDPHSGTVAQTVSHFLYGEAGGLGGAVGRVDVGEYAKVLERRTVSPKVVGAIPGDWMKIRTLYEPREGWISTDMSRPAPSG
jgi:hypothetical protein